MNSKSAFYSILVLVGAALGQCPAQDLVVPNYGAPVAVADGCGQPTQVYLVVTKHKSLFGPCTGGLLGGCFKHKDCCTPKCETPCAPPCAPACNTCAPKCVVLKVKAVSPKCATCAPACNTCAPAPACNTCAPAPACNTCAPAPTCNTCAPGCKLFGHNKCLKGVVVGYAQVPTPGCPTCGVSGVTGVPGLAGVPTLPGVYGTVPPPVSVPPQYGPYNAPGQTPPPLTAPPVNAPSLNAPTSQAPPEANTGNPYASIMQAIQSAQDKDSRAMREMIESRQANMALMRAIQDSNTAAVSSFEKMLNQLKTVSPSPMPVATPSRSESMEKRTSHNSSTDSTREIQAIVRDLEGLSHTVRQLSSQIKDQAKDSK